VESIKEAVQKAKASAPLAPLRRDSFGRPLTTPPVKGAVPSGDGPLSGTSVVGEAPKTRSTDSATSALSQPPWTPAAIAPNPAHLEKNRIVSLAMKDPSHVAFNLLRTKIYKTLTDNHWRTLAVTSPTAGCGKTMVAVNLGFSLARQPNCRTVLIDLDLRKASVARTVGLEAKGSIGLFLQGKAAFEDCFVRVSDNLTLGLNTHTVRNSAELLHDPRLKQLLARVQETLAPDVVLFDLPPVLASDDALAFAPNVDAYLLVAAAGKTNAAQLQECERHLAGHQGYLGVVLNKSSERTDRYYYQTS
jgi:protein-tyrosine kinase